MTDESTVIPYAALAIPTPGDALVFAPHPDDEVFGCAGAIRAHLAHGHRVELVVVTDGAEQAGSPATRREESFAAAAVLGCGAPEFWGLPDRALFYGEALVERIRHKLQANAARAIYAPSPWEVHPDHLALSLAVTEALRRLGGERTLALYEVGAPLQPNRLLDLGPHLETKQRAMACFRSQLAVQRYDRHIDGLNRFRAYTLGPDVEAAEAFLVTPADALRDGGLRAFHAAPAARRLAQGSAVDAAEQPLVSIICRTMGRPEFADAVASVAVQTYPNIELIVVDAAARGLVLGPWCGRFRQRVVGGGGLLGRAAACNAGLDAACGVYCLFLDEDDWIDPDHVAKLAHALQVRSNHPAAYTGVAVVDPSGQRIGRTFESDFDPFRLLTMNFMPIHAVLFCRATAIAGCRFDESLDIFEDWDYWLQLARSGAFLVVSGVSAYYRQGGESGFGAASSVPDDAEYAFTKQAGFVAVLARHVARTPADALWPVLVSARTKFDDRQAGANLLQEELTRVRDTAQAQEAKLREMIQVRDHELEAVRAELEVARAELAHVFGSRAWRLSAPYRWLVRQLNRCGIGIKARGQER